MWVAPTIILGGLAVAGLATGYAADKTTELTKWVVVGGGLYLLYKVVKK